VIPNNVCTVRLTAAAGTNLARASSRDRSGRFYGFPPPRQCFTTRRPSSHTRRRSVMLAHIAEDPRLQPPVGVWPVSQCQWRGSCSHTRYASCLGGPLPRQLANTTWAPHEAKFISRQEDAFPTARWYYPVSLPAIPIPEVGYPCITAPYATFPVLLRFSFDLHA